MKTTCKKTRIFVLAAVVATTFYPVASTAGDATVGQQKAATCLACHRAGNGTLDQNTPIVSGQYEDYIVQALRNYKSGARDNPIMNSFVASLSETDMKDIAAYYANMESRLFTPTE